MIEPPELYWLARVTSDEAECEFGDTHYVQRVLEVALARAISHHDVRGTWSPHVYPGRGVKAIDQDERLFFRDWPSFDESAMGSHWMGPEEKKTRWVELPSREEYMRRFHDPDGLLEEFRRLGMP